MTLLRRPRPGATRRVPSLVAQPLHRFVRNQRPAQVTAPGKPGGIVVVDGDDPHPLDTPTPPGAVLRVIVHPDGHEPAPAPAPHGPYGPTCTTCHDALGPHDISPCAVCRATGIATTA